MRAVRRALIAFVVLVVLVGLVWGPSYFRGFSLVVRAADLDGWLKTVAASGARPYTTGAAGEIPTRHGPVPLRVYRPSGRITRTTLLTPGVHAMGIDEPRLVGLAGDLAASGIAVATIALPDLMRYRFTPAAVDQIEDAAAWVAAQRELSPDGRVGLMGISFAGGLSVVAAGRPALRDKAAYVFSFGGHGDLQRVLRYLCTGLEPLPPGAPAGTRPHLRPPHDYGVAVILIGLADRMVPEAQVVPLRRGLETFLTASQLTLVDMELAKKTFAESQAIAAALPDPSRTLMEYVNARDTAALGARLLPVLDRIGDEEYPPALSAERSPPPAAPVYLLHGADDTVIPAVESTLLARHLEGHGTEVHALLSGLITHAEVDRSAAAAETWALVAFWARLLGE
jgi:dienelactone hydrolase